MQTSRQDGVRVRISSTHLIPLFTPVLGGTIDSGERNQLVLPLRTRNRKC